MARNFWDGNFEKLNTDINPRFEILFADLKNHNISKYLVSREFKINMTSFNAYVSWKYVFDQVKRESRVTILGHDQSPMYAERTLAVYLNALEKNPDLEDLIITIISNFIEAETFQEDFTDVLESAILLGFEEENIALIKKAIDINSKKQQKNKPDNTSNIAKQELDKTKVFIVHGHDDGLKNEVARLIEKQGHEAIILHEQASGGRTIIEKIEKYSDVGFGIVLYTPCDEGRKVGAENMNLRARQNVVFEHGYLIGKIDRENVVALVKGNIETASDISGVIYIQYGRNWQFDLLKEMQNSGYKVDFNKF